jgi:hypothetical protein
MLESNLAEADSSIREDGSRKFGARRSILAWHRPGAAGGLSVGMFLCLVWLAVVGTATVGVFFGIGFLLLVHPTEELIADPADASPTAGATPVAAKTELPPATMVVDPRAAAPAQVLVPVLSARDASPGSAQDEPSLTRPPALQPMVSVMPAEPVSLGGTETELGRTVQPLDPLATIGEPPNGASTDLLRNGVDPDFGQGSRVVEPMPPGTSSIKVIKGLVTRVPDAATWVVGDRTVHLFGVRPGRPDVLGSLVDWVRAKGPVECRPQGRGTRYQCFTGTGEDIAEAALLSGVGRAADHAIAAYRDAEAQARLKGKGVWAKP